MSAADARGVALASLERVEEAEAEAVLFEQARGKVPATRKHMICTKPRRHRPVVLPVSLWSLSLVSVSVSLSRCLSRGRHGTEQINLTTSDAGVADNSYADVLEVAAFMLGGEIAYRKGDTEEAFALLRQAVVRDATLEYEEPWSW